MPRKATWTLIVWIALGIVGYLAFLPAEPDCVADPTQELCDSLASLAVGIGFLTKAVGWLVIMVVLLVVWVASRPKRQKVQPVTPG